MSDRRARARAHPSAVGTPPPRGAGGDRAGAGCGGAISHHNLELGGVRAYALPRGKIVLPYLPLHRPYLQGQSHSWVLRVTAAAWEFGGDTTQPFTSRVWGTWRFQGSGAEKDQRVTGGAAPAVVRGARRTRVDQKPPGWQVTQAPGDLGAWG